MRTTSAIASVLFLTLLSLPHAFAATPTDDDPKKTTAEVFKPCQTRSPNSGSFFDLNPVQILPPEPEADPSEGGSIFAKGRNGQRQHVQHNAQRRQETQKMKKRRRFDPAHAAVSLLQEKEAEKDVPSSWHAKGHDYPANFTMNFCGPVVEDIGDVVGVQRSLWQNVSAYYTLNNKIFSLGSQNGDLIWRGRKLTLNYTGGSPCPKAGTEHLDQSDEQHWSKRRKSTLISLLCERDPLAPKASIAFVGTNDECTYFFEARSSAACPSVNVEKQQVGPSAVFGLIFGIAFLVYLVGGVVYQRAVMHQRGWRQLPNYGLWHGIISFLQDLLIVLFASCLRCCGRSSYRQPASGAQRKNSARGNLYGNGGLNGYASSDNEEWRD